MSIKNRKLIGKFAFTKNVKHPLGNSTSSMYPV